MPELDKAKAALENLGWSVYESRTYSALVQLGRATASKIAKNSNVPPNRVYQILSKLAERGVLHTNDSRGSATEYVAADPAEVLGREKEKFAQKIDKAIAALDELKERVQDEEIPITYTIYGKREVSSYLEQAILEAEKSVFIAVDTVIEIKYREILDLINSRADDIRIDILTTPRGVNDPYEKEVVEELNEKIGLKMSQDNFSTIFTIIDDRIMIYSAYGYRAEDGDKDYYGVYTEDSNTAAIIKRSFQHTYKNAKYIRDKDIIKAKEEEEETSESDKESEITDQDENVGSDENSKPSSGPTLGH